MQILGSKNSSTFMFLYLLARIKWKYFKSSVEAYLRNEKQVLKFKGVGWILWACYSFFMFKEECKMCLVLLDFQIPQTEFWHQNSFVHPGGTNKWDKNVHRS